MVIMDSNRILGTRAIFNRNAHANPLRKIIKQNLEGIGVQLISCELNDEMVVVLWESSQLMEFHTLCSDTYDGFVARGVECTLFFSFLDGDYTVF